MNDLLTFTGSPRCHESHGCICQAFWKVKITFHSLMFCNYIGSLPHTWNHSTRRGSCVNLMKRKSSETMRPSHWQIWFPKTSNQAYVDDTRWKDTKISLVQLQIKCRKEITTRISTLFSYPMTSWSMLTIFHVPSLYVLTERPNTLYSKSEKRYYDDGEV